jgi:hypothetical protein
MSRLLRPLLSMTFCAALLASAACEDDPYDLDNAPSGIAGKVGGGGKGGSDSGSGGAGSGGAGGGGAGSGGAGTGGAGSGGSGNDADAG